MTYHRWPPPAHPPVPAGWWVAGYDDPAFGSYRSYRRTLGDAVADFAAFQRSIREMHLRGEPFPRNLTVAWEPT